MYDVEDDDEDDGIEPVRFMWSELAGAAANFVGNLGKAVTAAAGDLTMICRRHSAFIYDRDTAYGRMQLDLESLPTTTE